MGEIAKLFEELQIMNSRLASLMEDVAPGSATFVTTFHLEEHLIDALEFYIRCSSMFDYARRRTTELSVLVTSEDMCTRAFFEDLHEERYPGLTATIRRRYPAREGA
jgi:hypothetical protein